MTPEQIDYAVKLVRDELERSAKKFGGFNSSHEGYAVLKEEVDEMWDDIKKNLEARSILEAVQVGAMALKYIICIGEIVDRKAGGK